MIPQQTCWTCAHFVFEYEADWSDVTPGAGFTMLCRKGHYKLGRHVDETDFAEAMQFGLTCPDYERKERE